MCLLVVNLLDLVCGKWLAILSWYRVFSMACFESGRFFSIVYIPTEREKRIVVKDEVIQYKARDRRTQFTSCVDISYIASYGYYCRQEPDSKKENKLGDRYLSKPKLILQKEYTPGKYKGAMRGQ